MTREYQLYPGCLCPSCKEGRIKEITVWNHREGFFVCSSCDFTFQPIQYRYKK
jgi:hypothetical protein